MTRSPGKPGTAGHWIPAFSGDDNQENQSLGTETPGNNSRAMAVTSYARRPALSPPPHPGRRASSPGCLLLAQPGLLRIPQLRSHSRRSQSTRSGHLVKAAEGTDAARLDTDRKSVV